MDEPSTYTTLKLDFDSQRNKFLLKFYGPCVSTLFLFSRKLRQDEYESFDNAHAVLEQYTAHEKLITNTAMTHRRFSSVLSKRTEGSQVRT